MVDWRWYCALSPHYLSRYTNKRSSSMPAFEHKETKWPNSYFYRRHLKYVHSFVDSFFCLHNFLAIEWHGNKSSRLKVPVKWMNAVSTVDVVPSPTYSTTSFLERFLHDSHMRRKILAVNAMAGTHALLDMSQYQDSRKLVLKAFMSIDVYWYYWYW